MLQFFSTGFFVLAQPATTHARAATMVSAAPAPPPHRTPPPPPRPPPRKRSTLKRGAAHHRTVCVAQDGARNAVAPVPSRRHTTDAHWPGVLYAPVVGLLTPLHTPEAPACGEAGTDASQALVSATVYACCERNGACML
jgi:hypothetical protein